MNRAQRRASTRKSRRPFVACTRDNLARGATAADEAKQPGVAALLREMMSGDLGLVYVNDRTAAIANDELTKEAVKHVTHERRTAKRCWPLQGSLRSQPDGCHVFDRLLSLTFRILGPPETISLPRRYPLK